MSVPTTALDENTPNNGTIINQGDDAIRTHKKQVREIVGADHKYESSGQDADMGKHNKVSFLEQADLGTGADGKPILGAQITSGKAELVFTDEDNNDIQITTLGKINTAALADGALASTITINDDNWSGTQLDETNGGTGQTTLTTGDILYASAENVFSKLAAGTEGLALVMGSSSTPQYGLPYQSGYGGANAIIDWYDFPNTPNSTNTKAHAQSWTPAKVEVIAKEGSSGTTFYAIGSSTDSGSANSASISWDATNVKINLRNLGLTVWDNGANLTFTDPYIKILLWR